MIHALKYFGKLLKKALPLIVMVIVIGAINILPVSAQNQILPLPDKTGYGDVPTGSANQSGQQQIYEIIFSAALNARYLLGAVAVLIIVYAGIRMVIAGGKEDVYTTQRNTILWAIVGLAFVGLAGEIARIFQLNCDVKVPGQACTPGGFLAGPNAIIRQATIFNQRTQLVITMIKYLIGAIAVFMVVRSGIRMITLGSQEDKIALDKKNMGYGALGLIIIILADTAINNVFFKIDPSKYPGVGGANPGVDVKRGVDELVGFTNLILNILSPVAVLSLVYGGFLYASSRGNEDQQSKAKRVITVTIVGIILMYSAFAIVSTFISGQFSGIDTEGTNSQVVQPAGG